MDIIRAHASIGIAHDGWVFDKDIFGYVNFTQLPNSSCVNVSYEIFGLMDGPHGFHVHEHPYDPNSRNACKDCGGHFNGGKPIWTPQTPYGTPHGEHVGDLCFNIWSHNGKAFGAFMDTKISLLPDHPHNIVGRSIMVHAQEDDLGQYGTELSLTTGSAGDRIACANIYYLPPPVEMFHVAGIGHAVPQNYFHGIGNRQ